MLIMGIPDDSYIYSPFRHWKRAAGDHTNAHVGNLWPDSDIVAGIMAVNSGKFGTLSPPISFRSPEARM